MGTLHGGKEVLDITFEIGQKTLFLPCESFPRDDIKFMVMSKPQYCAIHVMGANLDFFVVKKETIILKMPYLETENFSPVYVHILGNMPVFKI